MSTKARNTPNVTVGVAPPVSASARADYQELLSVVIDTVDTINVHNELKRIADAFNAASGIELERAQVALMLTTAAGIMASNPNHRDSVRTGAQAIGSACVAFL